MTVKNFFRHTAMALFCALALLSFAGAALAAENWIDFAANDFESGTGTADDPFMIKTAEQLALLAKIVSDDMIAVIDMHYKLAADIELSEGDRQWTPIGIGEGPFAGMFDGDGHVVRGMSIIDDEGTYMAAGLFGTLAGNVESLGLEDFVIDVDSQYTGGLAGFLMSGDVKRTYASGDLRITTGIAGGLIGAMGFEEKDTIWKVSDSYATCNITSTADVVIYARGEDEEVPPSRWLGGLVGAAMLNSEIATSYSWSTMTGEGTAGTAKGGIVGLTLGVRDDEYDLVPLITNCDWLAGDNVNNAVGFIEEGPVDVVSVTSHDKAGFGVANMSYFADRGWEFGSGSPKFDDATWCYIPSDGTRPMLRAFFDDSVFDVEEKEFKDDGTVADPNDRGYWLPNESGTRADYTARFLTSVANRRVFMMFFEGEPPAGGYTELDPITPSAARGIVSGEGEWTAASAMLDGAESADEVVEWKFKGIPKGASYFYAAYDDSGEPIAVSGAITAFSTLNEDHRGGGSGVGCDVGMGVFSVGLAFAALAFAWRRLGRDKEE